MLIFKVSIIQKVILVNILSFFKSDFIFYKKIFIINSGKIINVLYSSSYYKFIYFSLNICLFNFKTILKNKLLFFRILIKQFELSSFIIKSDFNLRLTSFYLFCSNNHKIK